MNTRTIRAILPKIFWRVLASPFVLCLIAIAGLRGMAGMYMDWLRYGGELIAYRKPARTIADVYARVCESLPPNSSTNQRPMDE